uniref:Uncharacterized protein n=1 Tax=Anguilla anguilla TaxID=7936 RepID=A0A0E9RY30_ANGAN
MKEDLLNRWSLRQIAVNKLKLEKKQAYPVLFSCFPLPFPLSVLCYIRLSPGNTPFHN